MEGFVTGRWANITVQEVNTLLERLVPKKKRGAVVPSTLILNQQSRGRTPSAARARTVQRFLVGHLIRKEGGRG